MAVGREASSFPVVGRQAVQVEVDEDEDEGGHGLEGLVVVL